MKSRCQIVGKYMRTWFLCDLLALVPFDLVGFRQMRGTRILRCLRLLKLARIVRGNRALQSWRHRTTVSYQTQDLMQTILTTFFLVLTRLSFAQELFWRAARQCAGVA